MVFTIIGNALPVIAPARNTASHAMTGALDLLVVFPDLLGELSPILPFAFCELSFNSLIFPLSARFSNFSSFISESRICMELVSLVLSLKLFFILYTILGVEFSSSNLKYC